MPLSQREGHLSRRRPAGQAWGTTPSQDVGLRQERSCTDSAFPTPARTPQLKLPSHTVSLHRLVLGSPHGGAFLQPLSRKLSSWNNSQLSEKLQDRRAALSSRTRPGPRGSIQQPPQQGWWTPPSASDVCSVPGPRTEARGLQISGSLCPCRRQHQAGVWGDPLGRARGTRLCQVCL